MTVTLELPPDMEAMLNQEAAVYGQSLEDYILRHLREVSVTQKQEFEAAVSGIRRGMADAAAGREISLENYLAEIAGTAV